MNVRSFSVGLVAISVAVAGCHSRDIAVGSVGEPLISDAVHNGGRAGFYFLPPLVPVVTLPPVFDPDLALIGRLDGHGASFDFPMAVDPEAQLYLGSLDTSGLGLVVGASYRVHVLAGELELGFVNVVIFDKHAKSAATDETFELIEGKKLKIRVYVNGCGAVTCEATACRKPGTCDPATGTCSLGLPFADGTACGDGNACNGAEVCQAGTCESGTAVVCNDGDACTADSCAPESGACSVSPIAGCCNSAADCSDGDACTLDTCSAPGGTCSHAAATVAVWDCAIWDEAIWAP